jgi:hypothetical protein
VPLIYCSEDSYGFNGMFRFVLKARQMRCFSSDQKGWQHVSVTIEGEPKPPPWDVMCEIKELFFEPDDWVVQYHPPRKENINNHPGCLHLWRPLNSPMPTPPGIMVGIKGARVSV